jgi:ribonuclease HII
MKGTKIKLESYHTEGKIEVGLDEVGRGCLAGPVVASAVILPPDFDYDIVKDSKKLSEKKRKVAYDLIKEHAIDYSIKFMDAKSIDDNNILQSTMMAMHYCLDELTTKPNHILVDGDYFNNYQDIEHTTVIKGDNKFYSIAAASILAKVTRDEYMKEQHELHPNYKWDSNKGYGSKAHRDAIIEHGTTDLHRMTFLRNILQS